jgi:hypothetical protein
VPVQLTRGQWVGRQSQREIPERTRTDRSPRRVLDLPIEAAIGLEEARIAERAGDLGFARRGHLEGRGQLVQMVGQLALEAALYVLLEQQRQPEAGDHQRRRDRAGGGQQQAHAQRSARAHHAASRL